MAGALKITYDVLLYRSFAGLRPPEELPPGGEWVPVPPGEL